MTTGAYIVVYLRKCWSQDASKLHAIYLITESRWHSTCSKLPGCNLLTAEIPSGQSAKSRRGAWGKYPQNFKAL